MLIYGLNQLLIGLTYAEYCIFSKVFKNYNIENNIENNIEYCIFSILFSIL